MTPLDTATLAINKNITIAGDGVAIVGSIAIGTSSTNAVVTLRGLNLNGAKIYPNGIRIDAAAAVHIENCTVERYTGDGIKLAATTATELFISDTVSRDNGGDGLHVSDTGARLTVENSRFENNNIRCRSSSRREHHPHRRVRNKAMAYHKRRNGEHHGNNGGRQRCMASLYLAAT